MFYRRPRRYDSFSTIPNRLRRHHRRRSSHAHRTFKPGNWKMDSGCLQSDRAKRLRREANHHPGDHRQRSQIDLRRSDKKCDAKDGVADGMLSDPLGCDFDPAELTCKEGKTESCLAPQKVTAIRKAMGGPKTPEGMQVYPG